MITDNPYIPKALEIEDFFRETKEVFTITVPWDKNYKPGQFVMISLPSIGESAISICSDLKNKMKLNIREVGSVTNSLGKLKKGDHVFIRGPYGRGYPMEELQGKNIIMVGGGTGVASIKGSIDYLDNNKELYGEVSLFLGYRSEDDVLFAEDLRLWTTHFNVAVSFDDIKDEKKAGIYSGTKGFVTESLKNAELESENSVVFMCGPHMMMDISIEVLKEKGFSDEQLYVSTERLMQCGLGKCGHCMIRGHYGCEEGPVFRYDEIGGYSSD